MSEEAFGSQPGDPRSIRLVGPEGVPLNFQLAGFWERGLALILDLAIIITGFFLIAFFGACLCSVTLVEEIAALVLVALFVLRHGYFFLFETLWQGSTPAKRLLGLKVVARDGAGLTVESVLARNLLRDVELFLPLVALVAPEALVGEMPWYLTVPAVAWVVIFSLFPLFNRERARAGDLVGGTTVVRIPRAQLLQDQAARVSLAPIGFTPQQLSIYGEHELETLATVLRKAEEGKTSSYDLGIIAQTIANKIGYIDRDHFQDPHRFLRAFYKEQRAQLEKKLLYGKRKASKHDA